MISPLAAERLAEWVHGDFTDPVVAGGKVRVFDVRGAEAYHAGHVPGAHHLPHTHVIRWVPQQAFTEEAVVLIDDDGLAGGPARHVAAELAHKWFHRLFYLQSGFSAWRAAGLPVESGGATGPGAASSDGADAAFGVSRPVAWKAPTASTALDPLHPRAR
jgi:rhodanese-related sulfurtransferase